MNWLYAAIPVYFDDGFSGVKLENGTDVAVVWLFPVGDNEVKFLKSRGMEAFEHELISQDPDLLDLNRPEMTL